MTLIRSRMAGLPSPASSVRADSSRSVAWSHDAFAIADRPSRNWTNPSAHPEPADPIDPGDRALVAVELLLVEQGLGQHQLELDSLGGRGDPPAEQDFGAVGMAVDELKPARTR